MSIRAVTTTDHEHKEAIERFLLSAPVGQLVELAHADWVLFNASSFLLTIAARRNLTVQPEEHSGSTMRCFDCEIKLELKGTTPSALQTQVGGSHYKNFKIQPVEFIHQNNLGFLEGCVIKRLCRWKSKDGLKDLEKAKHEIDLLIQLHKKEVGSAAQASVAETDLRLPAERAMKARILGELQGAAPSGTAWLSEEDLEYLATWPEGNELVNKKLLKLKILPPASQ